MRGCETWSPASKEYTLHVSDNKMLITIFVNNLKSVSDSDELC